MAAYKRAEKVSTCVKMGPGGTTLRKRHTRDPRNYTLSYNSILYTGSIDKSIIFKANNFRYHKLTLSTYEAEIKLTGDIKVDIRSDKGQDWTSAPVHAYVANFSG
ncbi:hypothetical protein Zmor_026231 [Zophobas morio]|uniref:Uncharacterized protein n=1 Tax=Zophobas morio TaxID=2755281 RepID=A0AA38HVN5_9CUCU|nr:hypothetical protein Zmor_026231 [Zophobas morio]